MDPFVIIGSVLTVVMSINAFFLRGVYSDMQYIKIELAKLLTDHDNSKALVASHEIELKELRSRVHTLEGAQTQLIKFIEEFEGR